MTFASTICDDKITYVNKQFTETRNCNRLQARKMQFPFFFLKKKKNSRNDRAVILKFDDARQEEK